VDYWRIIMAWAKALSLLVFCWCTVERCSAQYDWGYEPHNGPHTWGANYPICGGASGMQSPVALPNSASNQSYVRRLEWINFELDRTLILQNNGKYMILRTKEDGSPIPRSFNRGSVMNPNDEFLLDEVQFRWGQTNNGGSEHSIGGIKYPGEMTVISYNRKYSSLAEAYKVRGAVIMSVFFLGIQPEENVGYHLDELPNINGTTRPREIPGSNYQFLFPVGRAIEDLEFFVYEGSSTTPPCTEGITWHVYKEPVRISEEQMNKLRSVVDPEGRRLENNYRPVQPLNYRKVLKYVRGQRPPQPRAQARSGYRSRYGSAQRNF